MVAISLHKQMAMGKGDPKAKKIASDPSPTPGLPDANYKTMAKMKTEGFREMGVSTNALRKWYLLKSIIVMFEAVITFAKRHAALSLRKLSDQGRSPVELRESWK